MGRDRPHHRLVGGNYGALPYELLDSISWQGASHRAKDCVLAVLRDFNGFNNGRIAVSRDAIAQRIGSKNHLANRTAIGEAVARGLLAIEREPRIGARKATEYRLTFISTGDGKNEVPATRDYVSWQPGDAGSGKKRRLTIEPRKHSHRSVIEHDGKLSCSVIEPHEPLNEQSHCSVIARHIDYQGEAADADPPTDREKRGRRFRAEIERPQSVPEDRWILAGKRAADSPAGPDPDDLRLRVAEHVERNGRGSQTRLANTAGIVGGTLSKFLAGDIDMSNRHRVALACAMPQADAAEQKLRPRRNLNR